MLALTEAINKAVNNARECFDIKKFPGNFFTLLENENYIKKQNLLFFKEDIGKLSGFIGYGVDEFTIICINYKRPIGHQNFTLAHELGHWLLHKGQSISDDDSCLYSRDTQIEQEANEFAAELLYPEKLLQQDFLEICNRGLLQENNREELAIYVDMLCHKYCLSFEMVLRKILFKNRQAKQYKTIKKQIEKSLGSNISEYFDKDFYVPNSELAEYQQYRKPYEEMEHRLNKLVREGKIGEATADSIKLRNGIKIR